MSRSVTQPARFPQREPDVYRYITEADEIPTYPEIAQDADPVAKVRLFLPNTRFAYYAFALTEYGDMPVLSGYCVSPLGPDCDEEGDMGAAELLELRDPVLHMPVERDLDWTPRSLSEIKEISHA